jgi:hypothetical protein
METSEVMQVMEQQQKDALTPRIGEIRYGEIVVRPTVADLRCIKAAA